MNAPALGSGVLTPPTTPRHQKYLLPAGTSGGVKTPLPKEHKTLCRVTSWGLKPHFQKSEKHSTG